MCSIVPEVPGLLEPQVGVWLPLVSFPLPAGHLQTPLGGWPTPPAGRCVDEASHPVCLPCGSAELSHLVPAARLFEVMISFAYLLHLYTK